MMTKLKETYLKYTAFCSQLFHFYIGAQDFIISFYFLKTTYGVWWRTVIAFDKNNSVLPSYSMVEFSMIVVVAISKNTRSINKERYGVWLALWTECVLHANKTNFFVFHIFFLYQLNSVQPHREYCKNSILLRQCILSRCCVRIVKRILYSLFFNIFGNCPIV